MTKIHHLPDHVANQIAAGEVVERPASVAKELVENAIDAGARRIAVEIEGGGRRLLKVSDDGEGMVRDDAILAFERHATSKISTADDLNRITTLGFRGEALASIASVARIELLTSSAASPAGTRVIIDGGRMRDVKDAAHPRGSTVIVRDLFFNVPARRKFLRSEATESFHLTNLVTHYALAHPEIAFTLSNNGREVLHAAPAKDLRERAYQLFGSTFLENLLEVRGGHSSVARISGYVSAPRVRRTSRDAQFLFVNGRFVRDRLISRALSEGYRSILPHGVYPAVLLFVGAPPEEVDVNVHPAKTEVRFRRAAAVADTVRESVRSALSSAGYVRPEREEITQAEPVADEILTRPATMSAAASDARSSLSPSNLSAAASEISGPRSSPGGNKFQQPIDFASHSRVEEVWEEPVVARADTQTFEREVEPTNAGLTTAGASIHPPVEQDDCGLGEVRESSLPPLASADQMAREATVESLSHNIRPLGQLEESYIVALDGEGLLLIDQHVAHERILFDKYRALEATRSLESQQLLIPETFDLTPAQAGVFELIAAELENYGFELMRLSGRTVAIKAIPADLPQTEARNILSEVLDTVDAEKKGTAREVLRDEIAASLACHAAIKVNMPLAPEKMRWLIDRLLTTSSPTTCPHGRPVILRLSTRDILKGFHRI